MSEEDNHDEAASEGREFLKIITDVNHDKIDDEEIYDGSDIEIWLEELGFEWNGQSWRAV